MAWREEAAAVWPCTRAAAHLQLAYSGACAAISYYSFTSYRESMCTEQCMIHTMRLTLVEACCYCCLRAVQLLGTWAGGAFNTTCERWLHCWLSAACAGSVTEASNGSTRTCRCPCCGMSGCWPRPVLCTALQLHVWGLCCFAAPQPGLMYSYHSCKITALLCCQPYLRDRGYGSVGA
jgi:hypothetical protein